MIEGAVGLRQSCAVCAVSVLLLSMSFPCSGAAQIIQGRLLDAETGEPIGSGIVTLRGHLGTEVARTGTDSLGAYSLTAPEPGLYTLLVEALGYRSTGTPQFDLGAEVSTTIDVQLSPEPIELDPLNVEGERQRIIPHLERQGFYKRVDEGFGDFIEPEEIERRNPRSFIDLLRDIPGLSVRGGGVLRWGPRCFRVAPRLWVDGILVKDGRIVLGQHVSIDEIVAIEVYQSAAAIPLQYGGTGGHCAMFIWTKGEL